MNRNFAYGRGQRGEGQGAGPQGYCVCRQCGTKVAHQAGKPCNKTKCPKCGSAMVRE